MPHAYPPEFRRDVVAVARRKEAPLTQIAEDFGISATCLHRWLKRAEIEDGVREGLTLAEEAEIRELKKRNRLLEQENEVLRRAAIYLGQGVNPKMMYPLVRELAEDGIPVTVTCRVLHFSTQAYYKWRANPVSDREWSDAHLVDAARDIHADDPTFGYRFITDELEAEHGIKASENRVHRLCSSHGIFSVLSRRKGRRPRPGAPVHDDLVRREFGANASNELWFTDISEHPTAEGKLYLCAVKDAFSGRIVGYSMDARMKASLAVAAVRSAIELRRPSATVVHSDRGSQFRSKKFVRLLRNNALVGSMGRTGTCADNAAMESFFALLQNNVLNRQRWQTRQELRLAIVTWIERTYHRRRRQRALGKLTPVEFEAVHEVAHAA
ncbi:MAG: IS3 family transposase [Gemmatimonadaceae bacterium]